MFSIYIYILFFLFFFAAVCFSRAELEKREKNWKKENDTPSEPDIVLGKNCFSPSALHSFPSDVSETTFLHSNTPRVVRGSVPTPMPLNHVAPRLAIRNQSFVTNKDKCYKRPPLPLATRPLPRSSILTATRQARH